MGFDPNHGSCFSAFFASDILSKPQKFGWTGIIFNPIFAYYHTFKFRR